MGVTIFAAQRDNAEAHWAATDAEDAGHRVNWEKEMALHPFEEWECGTSQWYAVVLPAVQSAFGIEIFPDFKSPVENEVLVKGIAHFAETGTIEVSGLEGYDKPADGLRLIASFLDWVSERAAEGMVIYK